jgi:hypothetical protein
MIRDFSLLVLFACLVLYAHADSCGNSNLQDCSKDMFDNEGEYVRCDLCVCSNFDDLTDDSGGCSTDNEDLFNCYMKYAEPTGDDPAEYSCYLRMKTAWVIGFVFISICACCSIAACCSYIFRPKKEVVIIRQNLL